MNKIFNTTCLLTFIMILTFMFGMFVGRETAPQPQTIQWNDPRNPFTWTHLEDNLSDNLTPATREYLEAHPDIVDPNKR